MGDGRAAKQHGGNIVTQRVDNPESLNLLKVLGSGRK